MELKIYSLFSGSSGNCTWFKIGDLQFLIDAGGSCKAINDALRSLGSSLDKISHIFVTHEHSDHVKGLPVICKRFKPTLHINKGSFRNSTALCGALDPMLVDFLVADGTPVQLGEGVKVYAYKTPHDSYQSCAYVVECGEKRFAVATDMGYVTKGIAEILTGVEVVDEVSAVKAAEVLCALGVTKVVITLGSDGAMLYEDDKAEIIPAHKVNAVDTTAAGDVYNGAMCAALAEGMSLVEALRFATKASAISVSREGAQPSIPSREEVDNFAVSK